MNRDQKAAVIDEVATQIREAEAVYAVDYRGTSVPQAAELRTKLRDTDTRFRVVKNTLTERAADDAGAEALKPYLAGPDRARLRQAATPRPPPRRSPTSAAPPACSRSRAAG